MQTYYAVLYHNGKPSQFGESKHTAKNIDTFRKKWVDVYKNDHDPDFRMRVWNGNRELGDMTFKGKTAIWTPANSDSYPSEIDPKTGKLVKKA